MVGIELIMGYFITGIIWGSTNALMEIGSKDDEKKEKAGDGKDGKNELSEGVKMFTRLAFLVPFLINQAASIFNNFLVAKSDLSIAVPIVNCVTFMATFITARLLVQRQAAKAGRPNDAPSLIDPRFFAGSVLIMAGLYLCLNKE